MRLVQKCRFISLVLLSIFILLLPIQSIFAQDSQPLVPIIVPRVGPYANSAPTVADNYQIYNDLIVPKLPVQARKADIADDGEQQTPPGHGIRETIDAIGNGLTLYSPPNACNDFNRYNEWHSQIAPSNDIGSDYYAGWGGYAIDDGWFHHADNVVFSREQVVGPGYKASNEQFSMKIASNQPYAAGIGSPIISVSPGSLITVTVKYLIFDHDTHGQDYDWVSLGIKPDAASETAIYRNGYVRGQWSALSQTITVGESGEIMILIQAQSPAALNSNIYFDDIQIAVDGIHLADCTHH